MPSIRDFSGGVVNQELLGKDGGAGIMIDANNVLSSWNGELRKRTGTAWLANLPENKRIIPFRKPDGDDLILLAGNGILEAYEYVNDSEIKPFYVPTGEAPVFPNSGWAGNTTNGDYEIKLSSTADSSEWGAGFDLTPNVGGQKFFGKGALFAGGYNSSANTTAFVQISSNSPQVFDSTRIRWCLTCSGDRKGHYKGWLEPIIQYSDDGELWTSVLTTSKNPLPFGGTDAYRASYTYGIGGSQKTENYVLFEVANVNHILPHKHWRIFFQTRIANRTTVGSERLDLFVSDVKYVSAEQKAFVKESSFFTEQNAVKIKYSQNGNTMILVNGTDKPLNITYRTGSLNVEEHVMSDFDFVSQGYPKCVCFYQNRLFFAGFDLHPTRVWGSAFGNPSDFKRPADGEMKSTSPIYADCVEIKSIIENLWGGTNALYCLSADGVSMIDAQGGIVATNNIEFKLRNREPADSMTPTVKDDVMIYLGRDKRKIFMTDFDFVVQRFKAHNISKTYDNFFKSGIRELHFVPTKSSLIYGLLENGKGFCLLLDTDATKNAIVPLAIDGQIWDVQPVKHGDNTNLCMITQRSGGFMLEHKLPQECQDLMDFFTEEEKQDYSQSIIASNNVYLDCLVRRSYEEATNNIQNLPYSSGQIVSVYADGRFLGEKQIYSFSGGTMYAWSSVNGETFYTDTDQPNAQTIIYDEFGEPTDKFGIISNVGAGKITTHIKSLGDVAYYAWRAVTSVTVTPREGYNDNGVFNRYLEGDTTSYPAGYAWKQGNLIRYSYEPENPMTERGWLYGGAATRQPAVSQIVSMQTQVLYSKDRSVVVGTKVYSTDFFEHGNITSVGTDKAGQTAYTYDYVEINGVHYYRHSAGDTYREEPIDSYVDFLRDESKDISYQGNGISLDEDVLNVVIGIPYESVAVLKFATPYTSKKHVKEIATYFINTGYLEIGNSFDNLHPILNNVYDKVDLLNKPILLNGEYVKTIDKTVDNLPYVILKSDKALPFMITGLDLKIDYSNYQGGI